MAWKRTMFNAILKGLSMLFILPTSRKSFIKHFGLSAVSTVIVHLVCGTVAVLADDSFGDHGGEVLTSCTDLLMGQFVCSEPEIDPVTQQAKGCTNEDPHVFVSCSVAPGVVCDGLSDNKTFKKRVPCKWTNGRSFETALLLSVFLGMFGVDRFYLGYPAIGLVKFATLGFMFLGQLVDILLIATQVLTPADGSAYIVDYYGAATERLFQDNETYLRPGGVVVL